MNYGETLDYLYEKLPMFTRVGQSAYKKDLTNINLLCEALGNPHLKFKSIHVAGTNGKGSTSHMMAAILQTAGYKTGLYTSPHLYDFRERIKINGVVCDEDFVVQFTKRVMHLIETIEPSFFEITVAMAFDYFAQQKIDIAVIEVGLGGRLDSTNIIAPTLSIITNIGYDHMHILGNSLAAIAFEKAGIIKHQIPVVIGDSLPETEPVFAEIAQQQNAPIYFAKNNWYVSDFSYHNHELHAQVMNKHTEHVESYYLDLTGIYQLKNILIVIEAAHQLQLMGWKTSTTIVQKALTKVKPLTGLHGRWEVIHQKPNIVLDVAHNQDGLSQIAQQLELASYHQLHIVVGMAKDKEITAALAQLPHQATYYFTKALIPRALPENELQAIGKQLNLVGSCYPSVNDALKAAINIAHSDDLILVCGSVFVVAEVNKNWIA